MEELLNCRVLETNRGADFMGRKAALRIGTPFSQTPLPPPAV
ncbi:hypothetical protein PAE0479 [Pyrobaculum aerophilum str. IM2]|uniref:Uncharacterized protein n=1 Tax=Pyrobaculum aerophilum (strain ATCC 51768 / DSM 7523 / JCM 9630 / CIP 104966 / NBRC 100827 / IM2) TaxID=178306 RepID=Q8ZZ22_PYRAE|nr:hypothetical protein PAE0479 [Pyrobaculum aerophilum str. IM2]